jgi:hypothetical protein
MSLPFNMHTGRESEKLNRYMVKKCRKCSRITGLATVFPGEDGADRILRSF